TKAHLDVLAERAVAMGARPLKTHPSRPRPLSDPIPDNATRTSYKSYDLSISVLISDQ
ncbi:unnamed protein product, partial [Arctia plantaginis]